MAAEANVVEVDDCKSTPLRNISNTVLSKEPCARKLFMKTHDASVPAIEGVESKTSPPVNFMKGKMGGNSDFVDELNSFETFFLSADVTGSKSCSIDAKESQMPYIAPDATCIETGKKERNNENNLHAENFRIDGNNQNTGIHTMSNDHTWDKESENFIKQCNFGLSYKEEKDVKSINQSVLIAESVKAISNGFSEIASQTDAKDTAKINMANIDSNGMIENKYSQESVAIPKSSQLLPNSTLMIDEVKASEHINCTEDFPKAEPCMVCADNKFNGSEVCTNVSFKVNNAERGLSKHTDCFKVPPLKRVIGIKDNVTGEQDCTTNADVEVIYIKTVSNSPATIGNNSQSVVKNDGLRHNNGTSFSQSNNESFHQKEREIMIVDISKKKTADETDISSLVQISSNHVPRTGPNVEKMKSESNLYKNIFEKKDNGVEGKNDTVSMKSSVENKNEIQVSDFVKSEVVKIKTPSIGEFVSDNPSENDDNNNPEWELLKKLETDEERYKVVRSRWRNLDIPDPNRNLTSIGIKSCFMHPSATRNRNIEVNHAAASRKRTLSCEPSTSSDRIPAKRARTRSCTTSYDMKMENQRKMLENEEQKLLFEKHRALTVSRSEYIRKLSLLLSSNLQFYNFREYAARLAELHNEQRKEVEAVNRDYYGALLKLEGEHQKNISSLKDVIQEVEAFHKFYRKLDRDNLKNDCFYLTDHEFDDVLETEKLYDEFNRFYS